MKLIKSAVKWSVREATGLSSFIIRYIIVSSAILTSLLLSTVIAAALLPFVSQIIHKYFLLSDMQFFFLYVDYGGRAFLQDMSLGVSTSILFVIALLISLKLLFMNSESNREYKYSVVEAIWLSISRLIYNSLYIIGIVFVVVSMGGTLQPWLESQTQIRELVFSISLTVYFASVVSPFTKFDPSLRESFRGIRLFHDDT